MSQNIDDNPFADPFADPSVQQHASGGRQSDDYNPFGNQPPPPARAAMHPTPAMDQPPTAVINPQPPPPAQSMGGNQADLMRKQEELERKAAELKRREEELDRRARQGGQPANNWPPMPSFSPWGPCFYHDIEVEIPSEFQTIVGLAYKLWTVYLGALLVNVLAMWLYWFFGGGSFGSALFSIVEFVIFPAAAFLFWYRPLYKAFRNDSSFQFMVFFFAMIFQVIVGFLMALGVLGWGAGWVNTIGVFSKSVFVAIIMLVTAVGFTVCTAGFVLLLVKVHTLYRASGASLAKAQQEFQSGVMTNPDIQRGVANAAMSGARSAYNNAASGEGGRY